MFTALIAFAVVTRYHNSSPTLLPQTCPLTLLLLPLLPRTSPPPLVDPPPPPRSEFYQHYLGEKPDGDLETKPEDSKLLQVTGSSHASLSPFKETVKVADKDY